MGSMPIRYEQLQSPGCHDGDDHIIARSASVRPLDSSRHVDGGGGRILLRRRGRGGNDVDSARVVLKRCQTAPAGYVSVADVLGEGAAKGGRGRSAGLRESRLHAGDSGYASSRHRRRSPGPWGTRRGSFMHGLVKKYLSPCLDFLESAFHGS